jgi:hypothetical protein
MADSTYSAGTISLAEGGTLVSGALTAFASQVKPGDTLIQGATWAVIEAVASNTSLTLAAAWPGAALTDEADYLILRTSVGWHSAVEVNARLTAIVAAIEAGRGFQPDATGTLTDRALNNTAAKGFIFVRTDVTPFQIYIKASATSGDWAGPTSMQGEPGEDGFDGASVADVLAELGIPKIIVSTDDPSGSAAENTLWFKVPA